MKHEYKNKLIYETVSSEILHLKLIATCATRNYYYMQTK